MQNRIPSCVLARALKLARAIVVQYPRTMLCLMVSIMSLIGGQSSSSAVPCTPPLYQGYYNSCSGLVLRFINQVPLSQIDHYEIKRGGVMVATLPASATSFPDLQGCNFAASYEIVQVMKDGARCSTLTNKGMLPHSYPCDKCPAPTPTPTPTPVTVAPPTLVNAASFGARIAPGSMVSLFGVNLTSTTGQASFLPLPTDLMSTRVSIGNTAAPLLYVSPTQINLVIPDAAPLGQVAVTISGSNGQVTTGSVVLERIAPGLFTAQADGQGMASALTTQDGVYYYPVVNPDGTPRPVSVGTAEQPTYLVLFATGLRGRAQLQDVLISINGIYCQPAYAGPQPSYAGLDQINVPLPQALRGAGEAQVEVVISGVSSNQTRLMFGY